MSHQITITLSDEEYAALEAVAARTGEPLEALLHEALAPHVAAEKPAKPHMSDREFIEYLYRKGVIMNIPTNEPLSPEEIAEREELAQAFAGGKPASEMVIEDRGPKE